MSLKKKKIKKGKRNKIVEVLKNSLSKADEVNKKLLKQIARAEREILRKDNEKLSLEDAVRFLEVKLKSSRDDVRVLERQLKREAKIKGRKGSILTADDMVIEGDTPPFNLELASAAEIRKAYAPSEMVDPGDYVEIDENGEVVKKIDSNNLIVPLKESSRDLGSPSSPERRLMKALKNKTKAKVTIGDKTFEVEDIKIDVGGSKKVSKENDPYELLNEALKDCVDVPDGENYKDGYMDRFGNFIKNPRNTKT